MAKEKALTDTATTTRVTARVFSSQRRRSRPRPGFLRGASGGPSSAARSRFGPLGSILRRLWRFS